MYEYMTEPLIKTLNALPKLAGDPAHSVELNAVAQALEQMALSAAEANRAGADPSQRQTGSVIVDGLRAAAELCRNAVEQPA
ncbi:hypothetical protein [Collimonas pratensis]|uniref:Uncharacterized protein n=1 Tax=Collimonas pratensis TaxID=279113 RepID=A0A127QAH0_9BURK|nr:hypothetical protein [Collimonas pratensis]AMP07014.1 hypothetical protein CPter91_4715 [Collimonas pratensis]